MEILTPLRVYLATSWRNPEHQFVLEAIRQAGHAVYNFKQPTPEQPGFGWGETDPNFRDWYVPDYLRALQGPVAQRGFRHDLGALQAADALVMVMPCGNSSHLELGFAAGQGTPTAILYTQDKCDPELMTLVADLRTEKLEEILDWLARDVRYVHPQRMFQGPDDLFQAPKEPRE